MRTTVTCPRCGSESIYYHDVAIRVDYDYLAWQDGKIAWTGSTYDTDYFGLPGSARIQYRDGQIQCDGPTCGATWADLADLNDEVLATERAEAALVAAELLQFGEAGNYIGLEVY